MESDFQKYILEATKIGIILAVFTPLVLGPFGLSFSEYPKTIYFRTIIEFTLILYLVLLLSAVDKRSMAAPAEFNVVGKPRPEKDYADYWPRLTPLTISVFIFLGALLISSLVGFNPGRSFFGALETGGGFITFLHYLAFFLIISGVFQNRKDWLLLLRALVLISLLSTIAGFLQKAGVFGFYGVGVASGRISGTLSNPVYFGFFLAMTIFLSLYLAFIEREKTAKKLWIGVAALEFVAVFLSGGRSALLGVILGLGVFVFLRFVLAPESQGVGRKKFLIAALLACVLLFGAIALFPREIFVEGSLAARFLQALDPSAFESRFPGWETAIKAWRDRPIFGWGQESFSYLYYKYFDSHYQKHIQAYYVFNDAHNEFLNLMAESGLAGALSYAALLALVLIALWRGQNKMGRSPTFILIALFIAFISQNIFAFDTVSTYVVLFLLLGFINNHYFESLSGWRLGFLKPFRHAGLIALLAASIAALYFVNLRPALASYDFVRGFFIERQDFSKSLVYYQRGINRGTPHSKELTLTMVSRDILALEEGYARQWQKEVLENLLKARPVLTAATDEPDFRYLNFHELLVRADEWLYVASKDGNFLTEGKATARKALEFNDQWLQFYYLLGKLSIYEGKDEEARQYFDRGYELSLQRSEEAFEMHKTMGVAYWRIGKGELAAGHFNKAVDIKFASRLGSLQIPRDQYLPEDLRGARQNLESEVSFIEAAAWLSWQVGDKDTAREIYEKLIEHYWFFEDRLRANLNRMLEQP